MSELCVTCGQRPRKAGRRQCGPCAYRSEDQDKARERRKRGRDQRREYKRDQRRAAGCELMETKRARGAEKRAEREAKRQERAGTNTPELKPWLKLKSGAERFRVRYKVDHDFAQSERDRAIISRFTNPDRVAKSDRSNHWKLAAASADGTVTELLVRRLLQETQCYICGVALTPANRSIDHKIALATGGKHTADNLAACCRACNRWKYYYNWDDARQCVVRTNTSISDTQLTLDIRCTTPVPHRVPLTKANRVPATPGFRIVGDL